MPEPSLRGPFPRLCVSPVMLSEAVRRAKRASPRSRSIPTPSVHSRVFALRLVPHSEGPWAHSTPPLALRGPFPRLRVSPVMLSGAVRRAKRASPRSRSIPSPSRALSGFRTPTCPHSEGGTHSSLPLALRRPFRTLRVSPVMLSGAVRRAKRASPRSRSIPIATPGVSSGNYQCPQRINHGTPTAPPRLRP